ncbi:lipocalin family protein [Flavobacterium faecale]|uniref:lipocalin family protein n=1 Tax=Flavobacterium faecale TaxID=1355330 RepID=UPI003AB01377
MKKIFKIVLIAIVFVSCKQNIEPTDVVKLNGYWEIEKVDVEDGEDKNYKINEFFDYFEIKDNQGIRKKVKPQLDGTFVVNDTYENVKIRFENDKLYLDYSTDFAKWSEEVITLTDEKLVVKNEENKEYYYKKTGAINLTGNGKTTK